jgi:hypothetical protein
MARSEGFLAMALTRLRAAQAAEYITKLTQYRNKPARGERARGDRGHAS